MLSIVVDIDESWSQDQISEERNAVARALTATARQAAGEIRKDMPQRFTLRNSWVQKGIRADSARRDTLMARVYSLDPYLVKQEEGEVWHPDGNVAIPAEARPSKTSPIPRAMLPRALRIRPDVFRADFSKNTKYRPYPMIGLFQRTTKGKFKVLYILRGEKHTQARWKFDEQVSTAVDKHFEQNLGGK